jgi:hypothetical protein
MVLMGADTLDSEHDLSAEADEDVVEMRRVERVSTTSTLNILLQRHGQGATTREHIGHGYPVPVDIPQQDAADGTALRSFLEWGLEKAQHGPQDQLLLVLWGHAYDFAIGRTALRTGIDALDFAELSGVLRRFITTYERKIDIVGFDACQVSTIEMAYELRGVADYLLSSQIGIPLPGWPYDRILDRVSTPAGDRLMGAAELGSYIVRRYCETYNALEQTVTLTLLDLRLADRVAELTEQLSRQLAIAMDDDVDELNLVSQLLALSRTTDDDPFVDVADLCLSLLRASDDPEVRRAARELGDQLITPAPVIGGESLGGVGRPFIVEHGRNACETAKLHGASLYAPHVAPNHDEDAARLFYDRLVFANETLWPNVVRALV